MKAYFAIDYTIHFDDTMAYGGHHFLTAFKLQCASREGFLFGESIFDQPGVKQALEDVHLLTSDAYARNLQSMHLGDRVAVFLSLEEWGRASARFCYRVLDRRGNRVGAGFQTLVCADPRSGDPLTMPKPLSQAMDRLRDIEERRPKESFRNLVLAGGNQLDEIFGDVERQLAIDFLSNRYPHPVVVRAPKSESFPPSKSGRSAGPETGDAADIAEAVVDDSHVSQAWAFAGQGAFDAPLLCQRLADYASGDASAATELDQCAQVTAEYFGDAADALFSTDVDECLGAIESHSGLSQVAILLQNSLGARLLRLGGQHPEILMGHSFGEIAAFEAAGCFDLPTAVRIVCLRHQAVQRHGPAQGGLLAVFAERHRVQTESSVLGLSRIAIAGRNHDTQTIASGPLDQLERLQSHFRKIGVQSARVPSPTSFHHPSLRDAAAEWLESMQRLSIQSPRTKVYSPIGRRLVLETDHIASVLASQLLRPFDLQGSVQDLVAMGVTRVVDCGSTGPLAKLISVTAQDLTEVCCSTSLEKRSAWKHSEAPAVGRRPRLNGHSLGQPDSYLADVGHQAANHPNQRDGDTEPNHEEPSNRVPTTAIVGRGCLLPAGAKSPSELFDAVMQQRVGLIDQRNLDPHWTDDFYSEKLVPDRSTSHLSGYVNDSDITCPSGMDQQRFETFTRTQKLLCIALSPCLAGLKDAERIICLMGATADGFEDQDEATSLSFAGLDPSHSDVDRLMNSARSARQTPHTAIQMVLDQMVQPGVRVILVDAACASSLYTTALGMRLLETDQADAVIAGGVFCPGPGNSCLFSQFRGTTSTGCRPFDAKADGVVFSEGSAILTLRRADDASRLGLTVDAIIRGAGLSSDGRSSSANVPQSHGQILSLQRCYHRYGIDPTSISGIEGHGTSTPVGDSTEVETLRQFFAPHVSSPIPLHSLKGSIGHAGWAAGTASIIAACEYLRHQTFPPQGFYSEPSESVQRASQVLNVSAEPTPLRSEPMRIAVDGFGFGGANAHLVIERAGEGAENSSAQRPKSVEKNLARDHNDKEIVLVALHEIEPKMDSQFGVRFDRQAVKLPEDYIVLPELADDMDISQTLTVLLTHHIIQELPDFEAELRNETCVVLAMSGKTERGIEATTRVLSQRLKRRLAADEPSVEAIERAFDRSRPSKAYTLQCMMPNVAAGRAALLLNLRGPNFVVDAGAQSFDSALLSASLLLEDESAKVAIVATVSANTKSIPHAASQLNASEHAAAFALTTRAVAQRQGWTTLIGLHQAREQLRLLGESESTDGNSTNQVRSFIDRVKTFDSSVDETNAIGTDDAPSFENEITTSCPMHTPIWVEKPFSRENSAMTSGGTLGAAVFLVRTDDDLIDDLLVAATQRFSRLRTILIGDDDSHVIQRYPDLDVHCVSDLDRTEHFADLVTSFAADLIVAVQRPLRSDFRTTLQQVAKTNLLCEALFLAAQAEMERLTTPSVELWSLVVDGWSGEVHPCSGATAGLLKSIHREFPGSSMATLCTAKLNVAQALDGLLEQRNHPEPEPEIVLDGNVRRVRRLAPIAHVVAPQPQTRLDQQSVVVASGGARGVTAVMLEAIAQDYQCTIIALGRSPLESGPPNSDSKEVEQEFYRRFVAEHPDRSPVQMRREFESTRARWEADQNIAKLQSLGANVEYHIVDVTSQDEVNRVIAEIAHRYGKIDLLVHGAGVQKSKQLQHRSLSEFRNAYRVKVEGLHLLVNSCFDHFGKLVDTHVLTSAYSIFGNDGQHDYGAANETLDRLCAARCQSNANPWTSIAWLAWEGIGMTRGSEYRALAKQRSLSGVDRPTGQRLFRDVLLGRTAAAVNVPLSPAEHSKYGVATVPSRVDRTSGRWVELPIDLKTIDCLPFHKVRNSPTLPGAWILNHLVDAALRLTPNSDQFGAACVRDLTFHRFVRLLNGRSPHIRVIAFQNEQFIDVWMFVDLFHSSGQLLTKDVLCADARIQMQKSSAPNRTLVDPGFDIHGDVLDDPYCRDNSMVELSGPFQCLRDISLDRQSRRAVFDSEVNGDWSTIVPALALDAAWRVGAMYADANTSSLFVPVHIEEVLIPFGVGEIRSESKRWTIVSTDPTVDQQGARWARTEVCDETGRVKMLVKNAYAKPIA